jgi:hypothetical protein
MEGNIMNFKNILMFSLLFIVGFTGVIIYSNEEMTRELKEKEMQWKIIDNKINNIVRARNLCYTVEGILNPLCAKSENLEDIEAISEEEIGNIKCTELFESIEKIREALSLEQSKLTEERDQLKADIQVMIDEILKKE